MKLRKEEAIIRFRKYNREAEPTNWYRAKLMLYFPWYNEFTEIMQERGDQLFCELLCRVGTASCTPADIATLK